MPQGKTVEPREIWVKAAQADSSLRHSPEPGRRPRTAWLSGLDPASLYPICIRAFPAKQTGQEPAVSSRAALRFRSLDGSDGIIVTMWWESRVKGDPDRR